MTTNKEDSVGTTSWVGSPPSPQEGHMQQTSKSAGRTFTSDFVTSTGFSPAYLSAKKTLDEIHGLIEMIKSQKPRMKTIADIKIRVRLLFLGATINADTLRHMLPSERLLLAEAITANRLALNRLNICAHSSKLIDLEELMLQPMNTEPSPPDTSRPSSSKVSTSSGNWLHRQFKRLFGKKSREDIVQQKTTGEPTDPLRSLDIPRRKFGITGDTLRPTNVPKNFQTMVENMRACGHRRTGQDDEQDANTKLRHEAKFLGITETEYKAILLASGKRDPGGWKAEIENERKIRDLLQTLESNFDETAVPQLLQVLQSHPSLGKPEYYARLYTLCGHVADQNQKEQIQNAMRKAIDGLSSRKLAQFRQEVCSLLPHSASSEIFEPSYTMIAKKGEDVQGTEGVESRHDTIIKLIDGDLALLDQLQQGRTTLEEVRKNMKSERASSLLISRKNETTPLDERIELARKKLKDAKALQQVWKEHPEKALRYFHATSPASFEKILRGKIAVAGGGGTPGAPSYSGAFVSRYPLGSYGTVAIGFGDDIEYHARSVQTFWGTSDIWLGFDRAVVPDSDTARQGGLLRENLRAELLRQPEIQRLSPDQRAVFEIGLARLLENDLDVRRVGPNEWEAVLTLPNGTEVKGSQIFQELLENPPFPSKIQKAYTDALTRVSQSRGPNFGHIVTEQGAPAQDTTIDQSHDAHMRAIIVFDEEPLVQSRNKTIIEDYVEVSRQLPTQDDVRQKCETLGLRVNGEQVPIIPWTVAEICSDYDVLFGLGQFGTKPVNRAMGPISESRPFF